jgi:hypothetical protein
MLVLNFTHTNEEGMRALIVTVISLPFRVVAFEIANNGQQAQSDIQKGETI